MNTKAAQTSPYSVKSSIPVVRMIDENAMKAFYVDYLGFQVDWEHRFNDGSSPLYMQIHLGGAFLHLNGHADASAARSEVRIPVAGLEHFCSHLQGKDTQFEKPEVVDPRYTGRPTDMNMLDPSGNLLTFWSPVEPGAEMGN